MDNSKSSIISSEPKAHFESLYPAETREEEIGKILKFAKEGNSSQLIGLPGVGRSNILRLLSYNKNIRIKHLVDNHKWFHFVLINFSEIRNKPISSAYKLILLSVLESLRERKLHKTERSEFVAENAYDEVKKILSEYEDSPDEMVLLQGLKRVVDYLSIEKELTVVFLFDRFEEYISSVNQDFFSALRTLRNRAKYRFSVVFSINRPLEDLIEPAIFSDFYEFLADNIIYLRVMDDAGLNFRISYLEKVSGKKFEKDIVGRAIELTGGHGKLTRLALESLNEGIADDLKSYLLNLKSIQGALYEIWISLSPSEQNKISSKNLDDEYLEEIGLISEGKISIPLFEKFSSSLPIKEDKIVYDESAKTIKKGEIILSDILTSLEYKLLKFLLKNPNKTIERNEIIDVVWGEGKSTEGVTDQAIDQLIFRLRKKIEKDPNNPSYIKTLKGLGIRFEN